MPTIAQDAFVLVLPDIESASHYRTTFMAAAEAPVYVSLPSSNDETLHCKHPSAVELTRFGDAVCHKCRAPLWSLRWLAMGVFGEGTVEYGATQVAIFHETLRQQGTIPVDTMESLVVAAMHAEDLLGATTVSTVHVEPPTETVVALLNPDMPATTRRRGVPVPAMATVGDDWTPDPAA